MAQELHPRKVAFFDCSGTPDFPEATARDWYVVSVGGKIGGASGTTVTAGDIFYCKTDTAAGDLATVGSAWQVLQTSNTLVSPTLTTPTINNPTITGPTPVNVTAATVTLGATHVGRMVSLDRATGIAVILPTASGSGSEYKLFVKTTFTGAATVKVGNTTDVMSGTAVLFNDAATTVAGFNTTASDDTIDLFGTANSTGGFAGETITLVDVASGIWSVVVTTDAGGTEATPFSATV